MEQVYGYLIVVVLVSIVLYQGYTLYNTMDGFQNYTKIYKSEDGWYVSIRQGGFDGKSDTNLIMLMHKDWDKFKNINSIFDGGDRLLMKVDAKTRESLQLPDWDTFFITKNINYPRSYQDHEEISWEPFYPGKNFGQRVINTYFIDNGSTMEMVFSENGSTMMRKKFYLFNK